MYCSICFSGQFRSLWEISTPLEPSGIVGKHPTKLCLLMSSDWGWLRWSSPLCVWRETLSPKRRKSRSMYLSLQTSATGHWEWRSSLRLRQWPLGIDSPRCQAPQSGRICHWTSLFKSYVATNDGSWVKGRAVAKQVAPDATAVPWLLLESVGGAGRLGTVRFIQRTGTHGGNAPDGSCSESAIRRVPYTATYSFYEAGQ
jgi:hypothetical protein